MNTKKRETAFIDTGCVGNNGKCLLGPEEWTS